jgi:osmotically-inducible protein OsmY
MEGVVNRALSGDRRLGNFETRRIHITVDGDEVRLTGAVSTSETRDLAERLAAEVPGVSRVHNELHTDADLTEALQAALARNPGTADLARDSIVFQGVAELRGRATYDAQLTAKKMARAIDGIWDVADYSVWTLAA